MKGDFECQVPRTETTTRLLQVLEQVNTTACKRLFSLGCVAHTDGAVFQPFLVVIPIVGSIARLGIEG